MVVARGGSAYDVETSTDATTFALMPTVSTTPGPHVRRTNQAVTGRWVRVTSAQPSTVREVSVWAATDDQRARRQAGLVRWPPGTGGDDRAGLTVATVIAVLLVAGAAAVAALVGRRALRSRPGRPQASR